ncbi:MAG: homoserine O-succinyltransferase, partial [Clostridiales Family XIII bacterium]|nr:homoserine O-succinyltransferase [Clostridiales Family XIII bacterium]
DKKVFGVFEHTVVDKRSVFTRGFDEFFYAPHSRYTQIDKNAILQNPYLEILAESEEAGIHMLVTRDKRWIFLQGHSEYDRNTLKLEYERDKMKDENTPIPVNYFLNDDPNKRVIVKWRGHGNLFFANWLNFVYQETPYDLSDLDKMGKAARA